MPKLRTFRQRCLSAALFAVLACLPVAASAQRPTAAHVLPEDTLLYLRLADTAETVKRFQQTALGRISRDPTMQPLVSQLYGSAVEAFAEVEQRIGASLDDLLSLPEGELCFAVVPTEQGRPAPVLLVDVGQRMPIVQRMFERIEALLAEQGAQKAEETAGDVRVTVHTLRGEGQRQLVYMERDGVVLVTADLDVAKSVLAAYRGEAERTLADNPDFNTVMRRCAGNAEEPPDAALYVDPIGLFSRLSRGNLAAETTLALLPALGLDGVRGAGGSIAFATEEYDALIHLHLLLDSPRTGVLEMIALKSGDVRPEPWVPADVASYITLNWDLYKTYTTFAGIYDSIRGEDALADSFESRANERLGIELREEFLDALDGRVTYITCMVKPARLNSRANLIGLKLKDAKAFRKTFDKFLARQGAQLAKDAFAGVTYYRAPTREQPPADDQQPRLMRRPDPALAILDDYLLLTDSSDVLKQVISAKQSHGASLADQLEYRLIASKIRRLPGGETPGMIAFDRPEEGMRLWYELATGDTSRQRLSQGAENNRFFRALDDALRDNPLPPFAKIARYLAPSGSLLTNDESGLHYVSFTLRRK
jgi:hypothetical protein